MAWASSTRGRHNTSTRCEAWSKGRLGLSAPSRPASITTGRRSDGSSAAMMPALRLSTRAAWAGSTELSRVVTPRIRAVLSTIRWGSEPRRRSALRVVNEGSDGRSNRRPSTPPAGSASTSRGW